MENEIVATSHTAVPRPLTIKDVSGSPNADGFITALSLAEDYLGYKLYVCRVSAVYDITDDNRAWPLKLVGYPAQVVYSVKDQANTAINNYQHILDRVYPPQPPTVDGVISWGASVTQLTAVYMEAVPAPIALAIAKTAFSIYPVSYSEKDLEMSRDLVQFAGDVEKLQIPADRKTGLTNEARHLLSAYQKALTF